MRKQYIQRFSEKGYSPYLVQSIAGEIDADVVNKTFKVALAALDPELKQKLSYYFMRITKEKNLYVCSLKVLVENLRIINKTESGTDVEKVINSAFSAMKANILSPENPHKNFFRVKQRIKSISPQLAGLRA